ncbi:MAG: hypothetical protein V4462_11210 [Pseudomonadota bacterium]
MSTQAQLSAWHGVRQSERLPPEEYSERRAWEGRAKVFLAHVQHDLTRLHPEIKRRNVLKAEAARQSGKTSAFRDTLASLAGLAAALSRDPNLAPATRQAALHAVESFRVMNDETLRKEVA